MSKKVEAKEEYSDDWAHALDMIREYAFKIMTPQGTGTGFLLTQRKGDICGVVTAYHVISHAHDWELPIKMQCTYSSETIVIHSGERFILPDAEKDIALIMFPRGKLKIKSPNFSLAPADKYLRPGLEAGWAGYPAVAPNHFCFFSGKVSCYLKDVEAYLIDGVAINGISGGPAFIPFTTTKPQIIGIVTAYIPNRATGDTLPGVCFVAGIYPLYRFLKGIASIEQAQEKAAQNASKETGKHPDELPSSS